MEQELEAAQAQAQLQLQAQLQAQAQAQEREREREAAESAESAELARLLTFKQAEIARNRRAAEEAEAAEQARTAARDAELAWQAQLALQHEEEERQSAMLLEQLAREEEQEARRCEAEDAALAEALWKRENGGRHEAEAAAMKRRQREAAASEAYLEQAKLEAEAEAARRAVGARAAAEAEAASAALVRQLREEDERMAALVRDGGGQRKQQEETDAELALRLDAEERAAAEEARATREAARAEEEAARAAAEAGGVPRQSSVNVLEEMQAFLEDEHQRLREDARLAVELVAEEEAHLKSAAAGDEASERLAATLRDRPESLAAELALQKERADRLEARRLQGKYDGRRSEKELEDRVLAQSIADAMNRREAEAVKADARFAERLHKEENFGEHHRAAATAVSYSSVASSRPSTPASGAGFGGGGGGGCSATAGAGGGGAAGALAQHEDRAERAALWASSAFSFGFRRSGPGHQPDLMTPTRLLEECEANEGGSMNEAKGARKYAMELAKAYPSMDRVGKENAKASQHLANARAAGIIFANQNDRLLQQLHQPRTRSVRPNALPEVDLHYLLSHEALLRLEATLKLAAQKGFPRLKIICGKGNNSEKRQAKLAPAVRKKLREWKDAGVIVQQVMDTGSGCFEVDLFSADT